MNLIHLNIKFLLYMIKMLKNNTKKMTVKIQTDNNLYSIIVFLPLYTICKIPVVLSLNKKTDGKNPSVLKTLIMLLWVLRGKCYMPFLIYRKEPLLL